MGDFDGENAETSAKPSNAGKKRKKRRKRAGRRKVTIRKIGVVAAFMLLAGGISAGIVFSRPSFRISAKLSAGDNYTADGDYEKAQAAYEGALQIDETLLTAYRSLAQNYMAQNDTEAAKGILRTGWEKTQDEGLLQAYLTIVSDEAAARLDRLFDAGEEDSLKIFMDEDVTADTCMYGEYEQMIRSLLDLYGQFPMDKLKEVLLKYTFPDSEYLYISMPHVKSYHALIEDIAAAVPNAGAADLAACLAYAETVEADFADMFTAFKEGDYESAKDFIVSDRYQQIQDGFIAGESGYWEGESSIPVNQEQMVVHRTENGFTFFWLDYDEYENPQGVITVWGSRHLDDGIQRTTISYEPAGENGAYYPHTEYIIAYEYSNVLKNKTLLQMNYRFTTQVSTEEGMTKTAIGDWGGEHEWEVDYST